MVDIDCGGLDLLSLDYGLEVNDEQRNRFNSVHESAFNGCLIVLSPVAAYLTYVSQQYVVTVAISIPQEPCLGTARHT